MTRKVTFGIVLIILCILTYSVVFSDQSFARTKVASVFELEAANKKLNTQITMLDKMSDDDFEEQKEKLSQTIKEYKAKKTEYEDLIEKYTAAAELEKEETAQALLSYEENEMKDIYDVDFLWTIVGNYATEEGINLKFDINRNATSSIDSTGSSNYIVCDLKFTITGSYIALTDFIYDLEDDDRLNFEINNFDMTKDGSDLEVTLTVRNVKVNSSNLIDGESSSSILTEMNAIEDDTSVPVQTVDSTSSTDEDKN